MRNVEKHAASAAPQGARVLSAEEHTAAMNLSSACRMFISRQTREHYEHLCLAARVYGIITGWDDGERIAQRR